MPANDTQRTRDGVDARIEAVRSHDLPASLAELVAAYDEAVGERDRFLWKWLHHLFPAVTLSCVPNERRERVREVKTVVSMFVTTLDDLAESRRDRATFEEAAKIPFDYQTARADRPGVDGDALAFATDVWERTVALLADAPRRDGFGEPFRFDLKQNLNAVDYSLLLNRHLEMANLEEATAYDCQNMMLFTYADVDLLYAPAFDRREFAPLRAAVRKAQEMARIGNWVTTWEREVREGDFSSGVIVYALDRGIVTRDELYRVREADSPAAAEEVIETVQDHEVEDVFLHRWQENYAAVKDVAPELDSVDLDAYLRGMNTVMKYHMASRGWK